MRPLSFSYSFGQLIRENNQALDKTFVYVYDNIGNVTSVKSYAYTLNGTPSGSYTEKTFGYHNTKKDMLTQFGSSSIEYNSIGYPTRYGNKILEWENGKLTRYYDEEDIYGISSQDIFEFSYDAYGRRTSKKYTYYPGPDYSGDFLLESITVYDYDSSGRLIREFCTDIYTESASKTRELIYLYDESDIIGVVYNYNGLTTKTYYYRRNLQGDVIAIYDQNGTRKAEYAYDAFGNCKVIYDASGTDIASVNPIRYRGYYYDEQTKLYYLNTRYYNPEWRRFVSPSTSAVNPSVVNGLNTYAFMGNSPIGVVYGSPITGEYTHGVIANFISDNSTHIDNIRSNTTTIPRDLPPVPRWVNKLSTAIDHSFSIINPIRTASYISKYPNLWNLMRLDGITDLPGALSKAATGVGWGIGVIGGAITGYEKYASGASLGSSIAGGFINAGISIGGMYAATSLASYGMGLLIAANVPGGIVVVSGAIIAVGAGVLINYLATEVKIIGNTFEGHINNIFDWLIFWD